MKLQHRHWLSGVMLAVVVVSVTMAGPAQKGGRAMNAGRWQGDYLDIEGHRGRLEFTITKAGTTLDGSFVLALSTEDQPERYQGRISGTVDAGNVVLRLHAKTQAEIVCRLTLAEPTSYAEQAAYGVVSATPGLKLGGGVLAAWRFKQ